LRSSANRAGRHDHEAGRHATLRRFLPALFPANGGGRQVFVVGRRNKYSQNSTLNLMKLTTVFSEVFQVPESNLRDDTLLKEIPTWDSLQHMLLITRVEEVCQVQFNGDEIADMKTLGDVRKAVLTHGGQP
jgi:acyl carrier protein